jgi:hypothetical protein
MTIKTTGELAFSNITAESHSYGNDLQKYVSKRWWTDYTTDPITLYFDGNPRIYESSTYSPSYGNNPSDKSGWPYAAWSADADYSGSSGVAYYPLVSPGGALFYTFGVDNVGKFSYAITINPHADPRNLNYTTICSGIGFPGVTNYNRINSFAKGVYIWFRVNFTDQGRVYAYTFTVSTTPDSDNIVLTSRSIDANPGKPYAVVSGTYQTGIFAAQDLSMGDFYGKRFTPPRIPGTGYADVIGDKKDCGNGIATYNCTGPSQHVGLALGSLPTGTWIQISVSQHGSYSGVMPNQVMEVYVQAGVPAPPQFTTLAGYSTLEQYLRPNQLRIFDAQMDFRAPRAFPLYITLFSSAIQFITELEWDGEYAELVQRMVWNTDNNVYNGIFQPDALEQRLAICSSSVYDPPGLGDAPLFGAAGVPTYQGATVYDASTSNLPAIFGGGSGPFQVYTFNNVVFTGLGYDAYQAASSMPNETWSTPKYNFTMSECPAPASPDGNSSTGTGEGGGVTGTGSGSGPD